MNPRRSKNQQESKHQNSQDCSDSPGIILVLVATDEEDHAMFVMGPELIQTMQSGRMND
jgi:hypothetical protein